MNDDYRNTRYCPSLYDLEKKKLELKEKIYKEHPKVKILYNQVKNNKGQYKDAFMEIYNYKCSYCGNSIANINSALFEVDHYICESSFNNKEEAGRIENLVLACHDCNRSKLDLTIPSKYFAELNPDNKRIAEVFVRDDMYYICISDGYKEDDFINKFYEQLKLKYQFRRLDFLLLNIRGLCEKMKGKPQGDKLHTILVKLQEKRNLMGEKI